MNKIPSLFVLKHHVLFHKEKRATYWSWCLGYDLFKGNQEKMIDELMLKFNLNKIDQKKEVKLSRGIPPTGYELYYNVNGDILAVNKETSKGKDKIFLFEEDCK